VNATVGPFTRRDRNPWFDVAVWVLGPLFDQVTTAPIATRSGVGLKEKSLTVIRVAAPADGIAATVSRSAVRTPSRRTIRSPSPVPVPRTHGRSGVCG
jgi:hypothetical protein